MKVYRGTLVHCLQPERIEVLSDHVIGFKEHPSGEILFVGPASMMDNLSVKYGFSLESVTALTQSQFLMPGLVDTHTHPHMYVGSGTGYDKQLLEWVQHYVVPLENRFGDVQLAKDVYTKAVQRSLLHGTTTASYCPTIHLEATRELCRIVESVGQRALIGKLCLDALSPDYTEKTQDSLEGTRRFIKFVEEMKNPLIQAMIYPAALFACSSEQLKSLGHIAREHNLPIHSHIAEQADSMKRSLSMNPGFKNCSSAFEVYGLLTDKTYMAHCVYLEEEEVQLFKHRGVGVAHCPNSNLCLRSGLMDARRMLGMGVKLGLGTGSPLKCPKHCPSASQRAIVQSVTTRHSIWPLWGELKVGKEFDALLIDVNPSANTFDAFQWDSFEDVLMKFIYLGDDRNILKRFVAGRELVGDKMTLD